MKEYPAQQRRRLGVLLSAAGILLNLLLFLFKYTCGTLSGSVAVTADGFNNLADTGSCLLTLTGFLPCGKRPGKKYPMGCGRWEYLSGVLISALILLIGVRMLLSSFAKLLHPEPVECSGTVVIILLISILTKGSMYLYNRHFGRKLRSAAMRAAALDSLSDCGATFAILTSCMIEKLCGAHADGYTGILVALCILYAGITAFKESAEPLLGKGIDDDTEKHLRQLTAACEDIAEIYGVMLHDYGPDRRLLTFTAAANDPARSIPELQKMIAEELHLEAIIAPAPPENSGCGNIPRQNCPQYQQTNPTDARDNPS